MGSYAIATAEEPEKSQTSPWQLEPITVYDEHISQREDLKPDSPTNLYRVETSAQFGTEVFTQQDIQNLQPRDVNDLIDKAAGMNVTYQGRKNPFFIEDRGGGSFTYIIDGAVLPPSNNRILYKLPLASIEELQIVRGATSLTLGPTIPIGASASGSGLNTGFIIIRTKQPQKTQAVLTGSIEKPINNLPAATKESFYAGTRVEANSDVSGYIGGMVEKMNRPSNDDWFDAQNSNSGMANAGFKLGKFNLNFMGYTDTGSFDMQRGVTTTGALDNSKWYYEPLRTTVYSCDMGMQWSSNQTTLLNLFETEYDQTEHDESFANTTKTITEYTEKTCGAGLRHNARFGNTLFQAGGQMSNSRGFGPNTSNSYNKFDTTVMGWSGSVEQKFFDGHLVFDGGYRQDIKHIDNSSTSAAKNGADNNVDSAPANVFAFGSHWKITDTYALNGRYFHGDQGTVGDFDMRAQTGTLHPEKQERIEVGLEADYAPYFKPALTWFNIDDKNAKSATTNTYTLNGATYYFYTEADTIRRGLELMISGTILKNTTYKASWTHLIDNESTTNGVTTDALGVSEPDNLYSLLLGHQWNAYRANLSIKKVDKWTDTSSPLGLSQTGGLGNYTRIDANIQRDFKLKDLLLTVTLFGRNLADEHYSTRYVTGFYPDRGCSFGTEISLAY